MSYLALYRKYRPSTFDEIVGQTAVKTALQNQVKFNQIGHAYLFCGTRGTGKTSTAKVFARAVNCLHPVNGNPCNTCELCKEGESSFNVVEIDAASNNSVDNIRDLREEVQYTPSKGRFKVYIIDEVHMLSTSAFNALLKTLEEPPEHVIFILATTDPQKVLPTIVSRCQRYDFKRITTEDITGRLQEVCLKEDIDADPEALRFIASLSDGAMRDALSILDQCHAYYIQERLTLEKVQETLGAVDKSIFGTMTTHLLNKDTPSLLLGLDKVFKEGRDPLQFVSAWTGYLRDLLVSTALGERAKDLLEITGKERESLKELSSKVAPGQVTYWIEQLAKLEQQLKVSSERRILMEVALIRLSVTSSETEYNTPPVMVAPSFSPSGIPSGGGQGKAAPREGASQVVTERPVASVEKPVEKSFGAVPSSERDMLTWWPKLRDSLIGRSASMRVLSHVQVLTGQEEDILIVTSDNGIYLKQLEVNNKEKLRIVEAEIAKMTGKNYRLVLQNKPMSLKSGEKEIQNKINMNIEWR